MPMIGEQAPSATTNNSNSVSLYFHIPFCSKKCHYCHFYVLPDQAALKEQFMQALALEWMLRLPALQGKKIISVYFGGGTPYLLGPELLGKILGWLKQDLPLAYQPVEITLEANPENIELATLQAYKQLGINRLSIGIQSLDSALLEKLGRQHTAEKALAAIDMAKEAGIENISVDLMYDLPGQTLKTWETTLEKIAKAPVTHLSLYNLTIEPHTHFFRDKAKLLPTLPSEEESSDMYKMAQDVLERCGLQQYEISAFAHHGRTSLHNSGYWQGRAFLGLGPSAFSYWHGARFRNIANLSKYHALLQAGKLPVDFEEKLSQEAAQRELFVLQLRLIEGVDVLAFESQYGTLDPNLLPILAKLQQAGLLTVSKEHIQMTKRGILFYDTIATELI